MPGATVTEKTSYSGTLDGTDVDLVTLTQSNSTFTFVNRGSVDISIRVDGTPPTVHGNNCYVLPAGLTVAIPVPQPATAPFSQPAGVQVGLIAGSSCAYTVSAL